jgi:predicted DNA-binding protein (MmcQ/YjbR family)
MNVEEIREYCLSKNAVAESTPFDEVTLVFKVAGKMFALLPLDETELSINLKCDPEKAIALREEYPAVIPGYHMSKKHWNTIKVGELNNTVLLYNWIDDSYNLVVAGLSGKVKKEFGL